MKLMLLPPAPGTCPVCAHPHAASQPHNAESIYYQYRFKFLRGRWPTWADALAHCTPTARRLWERAIRDKDRWIPLPPGVEPIADPPGESFSHVVTMEDLESMSIELPNGCISNHLREQREIEQEGQGSEQDP